METALTKPDLVRRLGHELKEYLAAAVYLYICLGAILLYKGALLQAEGIHYAPHGLAAIKALILAKFMMVGHAFHIGERHSEQPLIYPILRKTFAFFGLLVVLDVIEEVVVGLVHGRAVMQSVADLAGGTWLQILASCVLLFLILLPYFAFREIGLVFGQDRLLRVLFTKPPAADSLDVPTG